MTRPWRSALLRPGARSCLYSPWGECAAKRGWVQKGECRWRQVRGTLTAGQYKKVLQSVTCGAARLCSLAHANTQKHPPPHTHTLTWSWSLHSWGQEWENRGELRINGLREAQHPSSRQQAAASKQAAASVWRQLCVQRAAVLRRAARWSAALLLRPSPARRGKPRSPAARMAAQGPAAAPRRRAAAAPRPWPGRGGGPSAGAERRVAWARAGGEVARDRPRFNLEAPAGCSVLPAVRSADQSTAFPCHVARLTARRRGCGWRERGRFQRLLPGRGRTSRGLGCLGVLR